MDFFTNESRRNVVDTVTNFTDEIEGELEKRSICGIHITRRVTLSLLGLFSLSCMTIGATLGVMMSSYENRVDYSEYGNDYRYWSLAEVIEPFVGPEILYDNTTHQHEALVWLAQKDPLNLDLSSSQNEILQRFGVAAFYFATNGTKLTEKFDFLSKQHECDWNNDFYGVFCEDRKTVSKVLIQEAGLYGSLPEHIGLLSQMEILNLTGNKLVGTIPLSIGSIDSLVNVDLSRNHFTGDIPPTFTMLMNLNVLDMSFNALVGDGAMSLMYLPALRELYLNNNHLDGHLQPIGESESLQIIDLSSNNIDGVIPSNFGPGNNLEHLNLDDNFLSGTIPSGIGNLVNLIHLDLSDNDLSGSLPSEIGNMSRLVTLNLTSNAIDQDLPTELGMLSELSTFDLSRNYIEEVPTELFRLPDLQILLLSHNNLSGSLPSEIGYATSLIALDLSHNEIVRNLPYSMSRLTILERLFLNDNQFSGEIPSDFANLFLLRHVDLSNNHFYGTMNVLCGGRPDWGNMIEGYSADCLTDELIFSCATECCDGNNSCCKMPNQTDCQERESEI